MLGSEDVRDDLGSAAKAARRQTRRSQIPRKIRKDSGHYRCPDSRIGLVLAFAEPPTRSPGFQIDANGVGQQSDRFIQYLRPLR